MLQLLILAIIIVIIYKFPVPFIYIGIGLGVVGLIGLLIWGISVSLGVIVSIIKLAVVVIIIGFVVNTIDNYQKSKKGIKS